MNRIRRWPSTILAPLLAAGCGEDGGAPVKTDPLALDDLPEFALEVDVRIGSVDDPDLGFSYIGDVTVAPDGTVYVAEMVDREIRAYSPTGELLRNIGGPGEGPGEFAVINGFGLVGDTLWVSDRGNERITLFNAANGEVLSTVPAGGVEVALDRGAKVETYPSEMRPDGLFASAVGTISGAVPEPGPVTYMIPRLLFDADGVPSDTVGYVAHSVSRVVAATGLSPLTVTPPYPRTPERVADGSDSIVVDWTEGGTVSIARTAAGGHTRFHRSWAYTPVPVGARFRDSLVQRQIRVPLRQLAAQDLDLDTVEFRRAVAAALDIPATYPPVSAVQIGGDGSIWLRREDDGQRDWRWASFQADGAPSGVVTVPRGVRLAWMDDGCLWAVELDELDVPWLVRYRIVEEAFDE